MKGMTKICAGVCALAVIAGTAATFAGGSAAKATAARTPEPVYKYTYNLLGEDEMPVMMFSGPISEYVHNGYKLPSLMTDQVFSYLKDCGVNTVLGIENAVEKDFTDIKTTLRLTDRYGINYVVFDPKLVNVNHTGAEIADPTDAEIRERMAFYKSHPSFAGLFVADEPSILKNALIKGGHDFIEQNFADCENEKISYVNMLPITDNYKLYSGSENDSSVTYEDLLDAYMKEVSPKYLSYDRYPFLTSAKEYPFKTDRIGAQWFDNIAVVRYYAQKYKVPFMGHIQVGGQWEGIGNSLPDENEFMWNINTLLAYGCKGISYFTGVQSTYHIDNPFGYEGLIALDGKKTRYWYYANTFNDQLSKIDEVLMNSANMGIIAVGTTPDAISGSYNGKKIIDVYENFRELQKVESPSALVGCFDYKGKTALYVVNNSFAGDNQTTLTFSGNYIYDVIQQGVTCHLTGNKVHLKLAGGEGALVVLN